MKCPYQPRRESAYAACRAALGCNCSEPQGVHEISWDLGNRVCEPDRVFMKSVFVTLWPPAFGKTQWLIVSTHSAILSLFLLFLSTWKVSPFLFLSFAIHVYRRYGNSATEVLGVSDQLLCLTLFCGDMVCVINLTFNLTLTFHTDPLTAA